MVELVCPRCGRGFVAPAAPTCRCPGCGFSAPTPAGATRQAPSTAGRVLRAQVPVAPVAFHPLAPQRNGLCTAAMVVVLAGICVVATPAGILTGLTAVGLGVPGSLQAHRRGQPGSALGAIAAALGVVEAIAAGLLSWAIGSFY